MDAPQYFVLVFGNPEPGRDRVESGVYRAEAKYPAFSANSGDLTMLYCTDGYRDYPKQVPGIGMVLKAEADVIYYRFIPFKQPLPKSLIDTTFEPDDAKNMNLLHQTYHRAFTVSKQSFARTVASAEFAWDKL